MHPARALVIGAAAFAATLAPLAARATTLRVGTLEYGDWPTAVASLQRALNGEGQVVHVVVTDELGQVATCGSYELRFDAAGAAAFQRGACDPATNATALRLVRRTELFEHDDEVPRPRMVTIVATEVRTGAARGGTALTGGSTAICSIAVRPYVNDLEHGGQIYLTPGRYQLRPLASSIAVDPGTNGWTLRSDRRAELTVEYEVVDTVRNSVVLRDHATLTCATGREGAAEGTEQTLGQEESPPPPAGVQGPPPFGAANVTAVSSSERYVSYSIDERRPRSRSMMTGGMVVAGAGAALILGGITALVINNSAPAPAQPSNFASLSPAQQQEYDDRLASFYGERRGVNVLGAVGIVGGVAATTVGVLVAAFGARPVVRHTEESAHNAGVRLLGAGVGPSAGGGVAAGATFAF